MNRFTISGHMIGIAASAALFGLSMAQAQSADYPSKEIVIIVPWAAGSSTDGTSRIIAQYIAEKYSVVVNVMNQPGGNTVPGSVSAMSAAPDGYTLFGETAGSSSILAATASDLPFDVMDRTFLGLITYSPNVAVVNAEAEYDTFEEFAEFIKKDPSAFVWSSMGGAGTPDIAARQILNAIGVSSADTKPVTASPSEAVALVAGGHSMMSTTSVSTSLPLMSAGKVKALAATGPHPAIPDVPVFSDIGYPSVSVVNWTGLSAPAGVAPEIVAFWEGALQEMLEDETVRTQFEKMGVLPFYHNSEETRALVQQELEAFKALK